MLTRQGLVKVKARALRRKVWFKVTSKVERGIVDLAILCVERIRSPVLTRIISGIVGKVMKPLERRFLKMANRVGSKIAESVCRIALEWGNVAASSWKHDSGFVRFLGISAMNVSFGGHIG